MARDLTVFDLLSEIAAARPDAAAVQHAGQIQSFAELLRAANGFAAHAYQSGARPGDLLGLLLPRELSLAATMFGSLRLGTTFVPLSAQYPAERLHALIRRHRIRHVACSAALAPRLPPGVTPILVSEPADPAAAPAPSRAEHPPYIIFTSGSSGEPKGVVIRRASLRNLVDWTRQQFLPQERRAVLASTPTTFDLSIFEIIATLACGGRIVLVDSVIDLLSAPAELDVSLVNTVPSAAKELVRFRRFPAATRVVNLAGEALHQELVDAIYHAAPQVEKVYNLYGPSEDTTYSTWHLCGPRAAAHAVPIGRPLPGKQAYLLDPELLPQPAGTPGEICLAGAGLAEGYLDDPALTAAKFVTPSHGPLRGRRLYRTGDLGSCDADGELRYLGRIDRQIKLRGVRIEPAEIEAALRGSAGVSDAVVTKLSDINGNDQLLAFVVAADAATAGPEIQRQLRAKLPEFMLPSHLEFLPQLPLTSNGKVDYRRLQAISEDLLRIRTES